MRKESSLNQIISTFTCIICSKEKELVSVGICDHRCVCFFCAMKSRFHYDYKKCPICLQNLETIFICEFSDKTLYQTLIKKKEKFYEDEEFDKCGIYYTTIEGKEEALNLRGFNCPISNCHAESFENINSLSEHINKVHKRFYCQYCLKENKLFLSQMHIYNKSNLEEHIKYGEYENNTLISPPHPSCPFDGNIFYNDKQLFSHMKLFHFMCQLCLDKNSIIFYPELKNLLAHYKDNHYCCPFQECLDDAYVVFAKEEELISHLITKHKDKKANERLNKLVFERKYSDSKKLQHQAGEFNFTQYIKNLKEESENYKNKNTNKFININENFNDEGIEVIYKYENCKHNYNNYNNYNDNYYYYNNYKTYNNFYNRNRGNNNGGRDDRRGDKNYYNNSKYNNNKDWSNKSNYNWKRYNKGNSSINNNEEKENKNNNSGSQNQNYINENVNNNSQYSNKKEKKFNNGKYYNKEEDKNKYKKKIDYSFLFLFYLNIIKEIITNKIKSKNIADKYVRLPKESIYQITVMIHKFDSNDKLLELTYLNNFGIDLEIHKTLKSVISSNTSENEQTFRKTLESLEIKQLLIIYKYLYICSKKVDNLFYNLDLEQIDEDLYKDFCERKKKEDVVLNKVEKEKRIRQAYLKAELNMGIKALPGDKKVSEIKFEKNKNKKEERKNSSPINKPIIKKSISLNNEIIESEENKNQNKKGKGKNKKGKGHFVDLNIRDLKFK